MRVFNILEGIFYFLLILTAPLLWNFSIIISVFISIGAGLLFLRWIILNFSTARDGND